MNSAGRAPARRSAARRRSSPATGGDPIAWLMDGDPAIRWQAMRDLLDAGDRAVERERSRVAEEGWGRRLLARQDPSGTWAGGRSGDGGLYSPKWISTTYTLLLLRDLGLPSGNPRARRGCRLLLDGGLQRDGGLNYGWRGRSETCITGMGLSLCSRFHVDDRRVGGLLEHLLAVRMPDGGWNCRRDLGATHSSVHTTLTVLEALLDQERHGGQRVASVRAAMRGGREFLLSHRLFRSHRDGGLMNPRFLLFVFPPRWHYDVLRALDHFREAGAPRDPRLSEAIDLVRAARRPDGRWSLSHRYPGRVWFEMERVGAPSRWNTLRALRVLRWWDDPASGRAVAGRAARRRPPGKPLGEA